MGGNTGKEWHIAKFYKEAKARGVQAEVEDYKQKLLGQH